MMCPCHCVWIVKPVDRDPRAFPQRIEGGSFRLPAVDYNFPDLNGIRRIVMVAGVGIPESEHRYNVKGSIRREIAYQCFAPPAILSDQCPSFSHVGGIEMLACIWIVEPEKCDVAVFVHIVSASPVIIGTGSVGLGLYGIGINRFGIYGIGIFRILGGCRVGVFGIFRIIRIRNDSDSRDLLDPSGFSDQIQDPPVLDHGSAFGSLSG